MNEIRLRSEIDKLKEEIIRDLKKLNRNVERLSCREESPGATTLDCVILLFLKSGLIDENGDRISERSYRRGF